MAALAGFLENRLGFTRLAYLWLQGQTCNQGQQATGTGEPESFVHQSLTSHGTLFLSLLVSLFLLVFGAGRERSGNARAPKAARQINT
ncbi:hypothetical protein D9M70_610450 [compost metagenome]